MNQNTIDKIREALQEQHPGLVIELDKMVEKLEFYKAMCIESVDLVGDGVKKVAELQQRIHYAKKIYIGMDGFEIKTITEGYCMQMMGQMYKELVGEK